MSYKPQARSLVAQVIAHLSTEGAPERMSTAQIRDLLGKPRNSDVITLLAAAVKHGALIKSHGQGMAWYALPEPPAPPEFKPFAASLDSDWTLEILGGLFVESADGVPGVRLNADSTKRLAQMLRGVA